MCLGMINSVSAWNHAEDMVAVSPLTTNVCMNWYRNNMSQTIVVSLLAMFFGDYSDRGGGLVHLKGEDSMATSCI